MEDNTGHQSFVAALRERNLFGLAAGYLVVGFGLVEALDIVAPRLQLSPRFGDLVLAILFFGFPVTLATRWVMAEKGSPRVRMTGPLISSAVLVLACGWLGIRALVVPGAVAQADSENLPLVILMDSPHPSRVYDEETRAVNGTNADVLSDVLLDLPIRRQRESIGPDWHRDEEILQFDPDLIVIHYSGFRQEDSSGPRERLRLLISYFVDAETRFLIYSRAEEAWLQETMESLLSELETEHPGLLDRVSVFGLNDYGPPSWLSPLTTNPLKLRVKEILGIP
jgi:hypothetical protein